MKKKLVFYLGIVLIMVSCYPQGPEYYEDLDVVYTNHDDQFDFASKGTYAMPSKIVKVTGDLADGGDSTICERALQHTNAATNRK